MQDSNPKAREEGMNALEKNVAVARGEALAASLLASLAIQAILVMVANREEFLTKMEGIHRRDAEP